MTAISLMIGRLQVVRFDLFGVNVFAIAEDDDFFLAPSEEQMALESKYPRSPVRNQPSRITASVASGRFQYPFITTAPRKATSPTGGPSSCG